MKRAGRVWIRISRTCRCRRAGRSADGQGQGPVEFWVARVKPGRIMFEIDGVPDNIARESLRLGAAKLPVKTRIVARWRASDETPGNP